MWTLNIQDIFYIQSTNTSILSDRCSEDPEDISILTQRSIYVGNIRLRFKDFLIRQSTQLSLSLAYSNMTKNVNFRIDVRMNWSLRRSLSSLLRSQQRPVYPYVQGVSLILLHLDFCVFNPLKCTS